MVGVEVARFPSMLSAMNGTTPVFGLSTIAEGIAVKEPGKLTKEIVARNVSEILLVDEGDIEQAIVMLLEIEKTVVEGAGAASLAALLVNPERFKGKHPMPPKLPTVVGINLPKPQPTEPPHDLIQTPELLTNLQTQVSHSH